MKELRNKSATPSLFIYGVIIVCFYQQSSAFAYALSNFVYSLQTVTVNGFCFLTAQGRRTHGELSGYCLGCG